MSDFSVIRMQLRRLIGLVAVFGIVLSASPAAANPNTESGDPLHEPSVAEVEREVERQIDWELVGLKALDAAILRPLGFLSTAGGLVIFVVSVPFVAPSGRIGTAWDLFVYGSYDETFVRPLGEI